jgi:hypothetical protein
MPTEISGSTGVNKIQDNTIVNADINSSAAIAGSKLVMPTGSVLQVVSSVWTGSVTTTSNTLTATGLTCNITPSSSSSKILVTITGSDQTMSANDVGCLNTIFRTPSGGSTVNIAEGSEIQITYEAVGGSWLSMPICMQKLDSPSTTTALTYAYAFATRDSGNTSKVNMFGGETIMTLMEIAG